ncbi:MAG TPA: carbohydrate kinase family protein [Streptosporangiaceae bacterium]|jgi:sugar/nucleoside kinase (ribokinase family)
MLLCCLGDVLLDVVVATTAVTTHGADTPAATRAGAGGQAANVAAWVVSLGGRARVVAKRAGDLAGRLVAEDLARRGVELAGPVTDGATGVVVSISEPGGERSMLTDRGVSPLLSVAEIQPEWLDGCDWLHLPLYSLVDAPVRAAALAAARRVPRVSVDLSSVSVLREIGPGETARLLGLLRPEIIFGNAAEAELAGLGAAAPASAAAPAVAGPHTVVVKYGAGGVRINGQHWPARPTRPLDSTGAGDAFAAGYLLGGVELGLDAAARAVSTMGAMP